MSQFTCQQGALNLLSSFAQSDKHSIVIEGVQGSGKTYVARQYARLVNVPDVVVVDSKVADIKQAFEQFLLVDNKVVIIVENLDSGVVACSYLLLKFMEEPSDNLYIVVTCRDKEHIPETILSRSMSVTVTSPTSSDIESYAVNLSPDRYKRLCSRKYSSLKRCVTSFSDCDILFSLDETKWQHMLSFCTTSYFSFGTPINQMCWDLGHFPDGSDMPSDICVRLIMQCNLSNRHIVQSCLDCLNALYNKRIASYIVLAKFGFDLKYCE